MKNRIFYWDKEGWNEIREYKIVALVESYKQNEESLKCNMTNFI